MKKIAITGGIASGKTTFLNILKELGFPVFSCDDVVKELYTKPEVKNKILNLFGKNVLENDNINKKKILEKIIKNSVLKSELENIFHPEVKKKLFKFFEEYIKNPVVFAEVPLLFEVGWEKFFDEVWVITCLPETQRKRLAERNFSYEFINKLLDLQFPLKEKVKRAHRVFSSEKDINKLKEEVKLILKEYL
jgi:dephospho-CoA kinase